MMRRLHGVWLLAALLALAGCASAPSTFDPQGPAAANILRLMWILLGLGTAVFLIVMAILVWALGRDPEHAANFNGRRFILIGGFAIPTLILIIAYGFTLSSLRALAPERNQGELTIEVIGHQYWWEVRYPDQQIITANEIHIPVGQPVNLSLTSADVIHSFWVPELHGKHDLVPGRNNAFWIQADAPGEYWGLCTEFCGTQHAKMLFVVVAEEPEQFEEWVNREQQSAATPSSDEAQRGYDLFFEVNCDSCHRIAGTPAEGELGPDLTHFASRLTLGAGAVRNSRGTLEDWVRNPHVVKPGNLMPAISLPEADLEALVTYLEELE